MKFIAAITLGLLVVNSTAAHAQSGYYAKDNTPAEITPIASQGPLTDDSGMTLYTFDEDNVGVSTCNDSCAASWPPYLVAVNGQAPSDGFTKVVRKDGTTQWAKDGAPLYLWLGDAAPGDTNGDGIGGVWHVAQ